MPCSSRVPASPSAGLGHSLNKDPDWLCVGRFGGPHGVKGLVKLHSFTEIPEDIAVYAPLRDENGKILEITLKGRQKNHFLASVTGIGDRTAAEQLNGRSLYIARNLLPELADADDFYQADLIGLDVRDPDGRCIGQVRAVQNFGAGDLLDIILFHDRRSVLLPFDQETVPIVKVAEKWLQINWVSGLLEAADLSGHTAN